MIAQIWHLNYMNRNVLLSSSVQARKNRTWLAVLRCAPLMPEPFPTAATSVVFVLKTKQQTKPNWPFSIQPRCKQIRVGSIKFVAH